MSDPNIQFSAFDRVVQFGADWWRSRDPQLFYLGAPALLLGVVLGGCIAFSQTQSPRDLAAAYSVQAKRAWAFGKLESADLFYRKAITERPNDLDALMESAQLAHLLGKHSQRDALVSRMINAFKHPPAFLIRAEFLLKNITSDSVSKAASLLERAVALDQEISSSPQMGSLQRKMAAAYEILGDKLQALKLFEAIPDRTSEDIIEMGRLLRRVGKIAEARTMVEALLVADGELSNVSMARAYAVLGKRQDALTQLRRARASALLYPEERQSALAASLVCFHTLWLPDDSDSELPLEFLEEVVGESSIAAELAYTLVTLAGLNKSNALSMATPEALESALASSLTPVTAHLLKGLVAFDPDDHSTDSAFHFRFANQMNQASGFLLSRCSLLLAEAELVLATGLSEIAMSLTNEHWFAIEVRGELLLAAGKWQAAVDLLTDQAADEHPRFYSQLAQAYEKLGDSVKAKEHRDRLEALNDRVGSRR